MPEADRERFEEEYRNWIRLMSRDAACRLAALPACRRKAVLAAYDRFRDPGAVFGPLSDATRIDRLARERISSFIVLETEAVAFFPSIYSSLPSIQDFAVALNRRFFYQGLWFPMISLNAEYIRQSSDRVLAFAMEHEFEMNRIYQELSLNFRSLPSEEKKDVADSAQKISMQRLQITPQELIDDESIMLRLSCSQPLLPKPFAEMAMQLYLEDHLPQLQSYGVTSRDREEESFGEELYSEFCGWSEFSVKTYEIFVREIHCNLRESNLGYG